MNVIATPPLDHDSLREQCRRLQTEGMSFKAQAAESGITYGTFTNFIGNTYAGDNDRVAASIDKWLKARDERAATAAIIPMGPSFVETATSNHLMGIFTYAQTAPDIVVAAGGAGIGKTITARQYQRTRPNVHVVTMRPTTAGTHNMLAEIAEVMSVEERSANKLARAIGRKVSGSNALIILDEAQHLQPTALDEIRSLFDAWSVGIALVGNETVYSRLEGQGRQASLAQLYSRVGMRLTQPRTRPEDVEALLGAWGIDDPASVALLRKIATKPGALRGMVKTIRLATVAGGATPANIRAAAAQLGATVME